MIFKKSLILFVALFYFISPVLASYQADVKINVYDNGLVEIMGESNHPLLREGIYDNLTTKQNGYWILNLSTDEIFSRYSYKLEMPNFVNINYLGVRDIESFIDRGNLHIAGNVIDEPFTIIIQYKKELFQKNYLWLYIVSLIILFSLLIFYFFKIKKKKKKYEKENFTKREYMIIKLLQKNKGNMSQSELEKITEIPKASLHRNILSLERKKIIEKNKRGMTNQISLKD